MSNSFVNQHVNGGAIPTPVGAFVTNACLKAAKLTFLSTFVTSTLVKDATLTSMGILLLLRDNGVPHIHL